MAGDNDKEDVTIDVVIGGVPAVLHKVQVRKWREHAFGKDQADLAETESWYAGHLDAVTDHMASQDKAVPLPIREYHRGKRTAWSIIGTLVAASIVLVLFTAVVGTVWSNRPSVATTQPGRTAAPSNTTQESSTTQANTTQTVQYQETPPPAGTEPYRPATKQELATILQGGSDSAPYLNPPILALDGRGKDVPITLRNPQGGYETLHSAIATYRPNGNYDWVRATVKASGSRIFLECHQNSLFRDRGGRFHAGTDVTTDVDFTRHRQASMEAC